MTDINNNVNLNNVRSTYTPGVKKEDTKSFAAAENMPQEVLNDGTNAADSYGRVLVNQAGKIDNPETVKCIKDSVDFFLNNPELAAVAMKACDDAYELLEADGCEHAYEKACCGSCDAAYDRV